MDRRIVASLWRLGALAALAGALAACATVEPASPVAQRGGTWKPYQVNGVWYVPKEQPHYNEVGVASWYGQAHQGKPTADGERFDMRQVSAAHRTLPLPSMVEVTNLANGKKIQVRVNDRGPFVSGRLIDLSEEAARRLGFAEKGLAYVRVRYVGPADPRPGRHDLAEATIDQPF